MSKTTPLKLLIADDHAALRQTLRQLLDGPGVTILEASSGEEAVKLFTDEDPDWVIMDVRMPGMGGLLATQTICKLDPKARIIAISHFTDGEYIQQARRAGALEFVDKEELSLLPLIIRGPKHTPIPKREAL
jgi:CheY-like chemotaxis protein